MRGTRFAFLAVALAVACKKDPVALAPNEVTVSDFAFNPTSNSVTAGTTVTWTFTTPTAHDVKFNTPGVTGSGARTGGTWAKNFPTAGTFAYHCQVHPTAMTGTITVTP